MFAYCGGVRLERVRDIELKRKMSVSHLIDSFSVAGGFTARKIAIAAGILNEMIDRCEVRFLSFPACIVATGTRGVIRTLVKEMMMNVLITTCGTLDHDIARSLKHYYHGDFFMDDCELRKKGINRLGNVLVPDESYGQCIERWAQGVLKEIYDRRGACTLSTSELCFELGKRLPEESILYWCWKNSIPVYVPGITDGAFGCQLWLFMQRCKGFRVDVFKDEDELSGLIFPLQEKHTGALIIGGGISKHHTIWWNQFKGGLNYAVYLTTAEEYDGSLSGARLREGVSWGKVHPKAKFITVEGDATITLPMLTAYLIDKRKKGGTRCV